MCDFIPFAVFKEVCGPRRCLHYTIIFCTTCTQHNLVSATMSVAFTFYVKKVTLAKKLRKSNQTGRTEMGFQKWDLNRISDHISWNGFVKIVSCFCFFAINTWLIFYVLSDHSISPFFKSNSLSLWAWSNHSHECRINTECSHGSHTCDGQTYRRCWLTLRDIISIERLEISQTNKLCDGESRRCVHVCEKHWVTMRCISGHDNGCFHLQTAITGNCPPDGPAQFNPRADFIGFVS